MTEYLTVNRELADKAMNRIDHALGRPLDPLAETYREYYAVDANSEQAAEFRASPHWDAGRGVPGGLTYFHPTVAGRQALAAYLKTIADPNKAFVVCWNGFESRVVAPTHSKARYKKWLEASDAYHTLTFKEFCKTATVRRVAA
jgi:hypothetical protein